MKPRTLGGLRAKLASETGNFIRKLIPSWVTLSSLMAAVTGGTQYCIFVETTSAQQIGFSLSGTGCGTLPVELQSFSIGSEDENPDSDS